MQTDPRQFHTLLKDSGIRRHPLQDAKLGNFMPRFKTQDPNQRRLCLVYQMIQFLIMYNIPITD